MDAREFQSAQERTECDQDVARRRLTGLYQTSTPVLTPVRLLHAVVGLTGEVGELAGAVERWIWYGRPLDRANLAEEAGDCLWYMALLCNAAGLDLAELMAANQRKLRVRYPEKYEETRAAEEGRDRAAEVAATVAPLRKPALPESVVSTSEPPAHDGDCEERGTEWEYDDKGRPVPHSSHTWGPLTSLGQGRCINCGRSRHLSGGFMPCPAFSKKEGPAAQRIEQDGHGFGHVVDGDDGPDYSKATE